MHPIEAVQKNANWILVADSKAIWSMNYMGSEIALHMSKKLQGHIKSRIWKEELDSFNIVQ